jgi:A/G-specific adenine glycosylase
MIGGVLADSESWLAPVLDQLKHFYEPQPDAPHDAFAFYVWYVLGERATPARRDAAMAALKRIPALTPDSMWKAARAKLNDAISHAGPPDDLTQALAAGVEVFRQHRNLGERIRGPIMQARRAANLLSALGAAGAQWMLLAAGGHPILPRHAGIGRVATRLGVVATPSCAPGVALSRAARLVAATLPRDVAFLNAATLYLTHHASVTCTLAFPHCRVCPLAVDCRAAAEKSPG